MRSLRAFPDKVYIKNHILSFLNISGIFIFSAHNTVVSILFNEQSVGCNCNSVVATWLFTSYLLFWPRQVISCWFWASDQNQNQNCSWLFHSMLPQYAKRAYYLAVNFGLNRTGTWRAILQRSNELPQCFQVSIVFLDEYFNIRQKLF